MLLTLAQLPEIRNMDTEACNKLLFELNKQNTSYSVIAAATSEGIIFAASIPFKPGNYDLSDRKHIRDVVEPFDFSAGEYFPIRTTDVQSINYTYPVLDADKNLIAIMIAGFKLDEYGPFIKKANLPEGSAVTIADHLGVRLYRYPESDAAPPGRTLPEEVMRQMMGPSQQGIFERVGHDGVERIYAFRQLRLREDDSPYLYMGVGLPKDTIVSKANLQMIRSLSVLGILCLITMCLAWCFGDFALVKPIHRLLIATQRLADGETSVRTGGIHHTSDELGRLARSFDDMAALLEAREAERAKAEELHRRAEDKYRNIFENALCGIFTNTPEGRFIEVNRALARMLGYESPEELKESATDVCHQLFAEPARSRKCIQSILDQGEAVFEIEVVKKDGTLGWVSNHVRVVRGDLGEISHFEGTVEDITERKRAEERLREYEKVVEGLEEMIAVVDRDYRYLIANRAFLNHRRTDKDRIIGRLVPEIVGEQVFEEVIREKLDECFRGNIVKYHVKYDYSELGERDLFITYLPIEGPAGTDRIACVLQDITERQAAQEELNRHREHLEDLVKERTHDLAAAIERLNAEVSERRRMEKTLRESEEKLRSFIETTSDWVWEIDKHGRYTYASTKVKSLLGYEPHEMLNSLPDTNLAHC